VFVSKERKVPTVQEGKGQNVVTPFLFYDFI